jgi:hypothetical protein
MGRRRRLLPYVAARRRYVGRNQSEGSQQAFDAGSKLALTLDQGGAAPLGLPDTLPGRGAESDNVEM